MAVTVAAGVRYGDLAGVPACGGLGAARPWIAAAHLGGRRLRQGTHGSGVRHGTLATAVSHSEIVTAGGRSLRRSRKNDGEVFAERRNVGALGVVTR